MGILDRIGSGLLDRPEYRTRIAPSDDPNWPRIIPPPQTSAFLPPVEIPGQAPVEVATLNRSLPGNDRGNAEAPPEVPEVPGFGLGHGVGNILTMLGPQAVLGVALALADPGNESIAPIPRLVEALSQNDESTKGGAGGEDHFAGSAFDTIGQSRAAAAGQDMSIDAFENTQPGIGKESAGGGKGDAGK